MTVRPENTPNIQGRRLRWRCIFVKTWFMFRKQAGGNEQSRTLCTGVPDLEEVRRFCTLWWVWFLFPNIMNSGSGLKIRLKACNWPHTWCILRWPLCLYTQCNDLQWSLLSHRLCSLYCFPKYTHCRNHRKDTNLPDWQCKCCNPEHFQLMTGIWLESLILFSHLTLWILCYSPYTGTFHQKPVNRICILWLPPNCLISTFSSFCLELQ